MVDEENLNRENLLELRKNKINVFFINLKK